MIIFNILSNSISCGNTQIHHNLANFSAILLPVTAFIFDDMIGNVVDNGDFGLISICVLESIHESC
ncbi:MAG: hypothetical protein Q8S84_00625 [bacterium]|nr:hypothetical protein [bacterium]MDP3380092.1 hypothetical protein [bacterium]